MAGVPFIGNATCSGNLTVSGNTFLQATTASGLVTMFQGGALASTSTATSFNTYASSRTLAFQTSLWNGTTSVTDQATITGVRSNAVAGAITLTASTAFSAAGLYDGANRAWSLSNLHPITGPGAVVDLISDQSIGGTKTFTGASTSVNGILFANSAATVATDLTVSGNTQLAVLNTTIGSYDNGNRVYSAANPPPTDALDLMGVY